MINSKVYLSPLKIRYYLLWRYIFAGTFLCYYRLLNTLRPRLNGRHFPDDIFKCIFLNENAWISIKISLKFVPKGSINNIPALVQIICVTRPQWVKDMKWLACSEASGKRIIRLRSKAFTYYDQSIAKILSSWADLYFDVEIRKITSNYGSTMFHKVLWLVNFMASGRFVWKFR